MPHHRTVRPGGTVSTTGSYDAAVAAAAELDARTREEQAADQALLDAADALASAQAAYDAAQGDYNNAQAATDEARTNYDTALAAART